MGLLNEVDFGRVKLSDNKILDDDGNICFAVVDAVPSDGGSGYAQGCILINRTDATVHINTDADATCDFDTVTGITAPIGLTDLTAGITPSHVVKYAGKITWSGSGASLATTVTGVAATDIVIATIQTAPTQAAYLVSAAPTLNTITLVLSAANTSNNAVIAYTVFRAAA